MKQGAAVKFISILLALFLVAFAGYHAIRHFYSSYSTVSAYRYTVYHSVTADGLMVREETVLTRPVSGYLRYVAAEGQKVKAGSALAYTYSDHAQASAAEAQSISAQELELLQNIYKQYQQSGYVNAADLSSTIDIELSRLSEAVLSGNYGGLDALRLSLQKSINLKELLTGDDTDITARIAALSSAGGGNGVTAVYSSAVGYFSHCIDGTEGTYAPDMIDTITEEQLTAALSADTVYQENVLGKIMTDDHWYIVTMMTADEAEDFPEGSAVEVTFAGSDNESVAARIVSVRAGTTAGKCIVILMGNEINSDVVSRRVASVKIASASYTGIRFDADLLHIVDGVKGVYVDNGYTVKFKKVDIIYVGNDYYLTRLNYTSEEYLNLFDKLIVTNSTLNDGMPLVDL